MIKRLTAVILAFVMVLVLTSCRASSKEDISSQPNVSSIKDNTVTDSDSSSKDVTTSEDLVSVEEAISSKVASSNNSNSSKLSSSSKPVSSNNSTSSKAGSSSKPVSSSVSVVSKVETTKKEYTLPKYEAKTFEISGFWAPYDISEKGLKLYKDAGFNTLAMINHSLGNTSREQFYLGSIRTMAALENCRKVGLNAILNYNDWKAEQCEGEDYNGETPFSKYDLYGEYKDIITGVHICDEPDNKKMDEIANKTLVEDFKKTYPNASYIVNLSDITWPDGRGYSTYDDLLNHYSTAVMSQFDVPYISVDCYPFWGTKDMYIIENYYKLAKIAKEHNAITTMILQSSTGKEFKDTLSEGDMRWQAYLAIAFGADNLQYYCYSVPKNIGYNYCILKEDGTPSVLYNYVKEVNAEVQSFSSAVLAYNWEDALVVAGSEEQSLRGSCLQYNPVDYKYKKFDNANYYVNAKGTQDVLVSRFTSKKHGEAYMFVNIAVDNGMSNDITAEFKNCSAVAIYGGADYSGTPKIVELDKEGKLTLNLEYGEGLFIVPLK